MLTHQAHQLTVETIGSASRVHAMTDKSISAEIHVICPIITIRRI